MNNKSLFFSALFFFISSLCISQTAFSKGFSNGYKKGYCQDQGIGCIEPLSPIAPLPKIGENYNSFQDGYNRGFQTGLSARNANNLSNTNQTDRKRYQTSESDFSTDFVYKPPVELMLKAAEAKQRQAEMYYLQQEINKINEIEIKKNLNPNDFAIMNIYRPKTFKGACCPVDVIVNGRVVEKLKNGGHLKLKVYDLSSAEIIIKSAGTASLRLIPQKDKIYYFKTRPKFSGFTLEQINSPIPKKKLKEKNYSSKADYIF